MVVREQPAVKRRWRLGETLLKAIGFAPEDGEKPDPVWRLWDFARPHKRLIVLGCLSGVLMSLTMTGYSVLLKGLLDAMKSDGGEADLHAVTFFSLMAPLAFAAKGVFYFGQVYLLSKVSERVAQRLRNNLFDRMQHLSLSFLESRRTGNLIATISSDVPVVQMQIGQLFMEGITAPVTVIAGVSYMMYLDWRLASATWITLLVVGKAIATAGKRMRAASEAIQKSLSATSGLATELLGAIRVVRSFGMEEREAARFREESERTYAANMKAVQINALLRSVVEVLGGISIAFVLWFGATLIAGKRLEFAELAAVFLLTTQVTQSLNQLGRFKSYLARIHGAAERIFEVLDHEPEIQDRRDAVVLEHVRGHIEFDHVSFGYGDGDLVLRGLSFQVRPGECIALVGPSGVGKSTIANLIPRFYDINSGAVRVDGYDVRDVTAHSLRDQIATVAQEPVLFSGSIRENIAYGRPTASEAEVVAAAQAANAHGFITTMLPEGYDTVIGERGVKLSGGQRQRIAIARALLKDPRILILDEATSALDAESEALVQEALDKLMEGRSTIIIAHRLSTVRKADRILAMDGGRVAEEGSHAELIARNGLYARLYERGLGDAPAPAGSAPAAAGELDEQAVEVPSEGAIAELAGDVAAAGVSISRVGVGGE